MGQTTYRDVAELQSDMRGYPVTAAVAVEMWEDVASPGCDEPVGRAFHDGEAGCFVIETLRRFPKGGPYAPLGMGTRADRERDGWSSEAVPPAGTMTVGELYQAMAGHESAPVMLRVWEGDDSEATDEGVFSVMEYPLQDSIYEGDGSDENFKAGQLYDSYGYEVPAGEGRIAYAVLSTGEQYRTGR